MATYYMQIYNIWAHSCRNGDLKIHIFGGAIYSQFLESFDPSGLMWRTTRFW